MTRFRSHTRLTALVAASLLIGCVEPVVLGEEDGQGGGSDDGPVTTGSVGTGSDTTSTGPVAVGEPTLTAQWNTPDVEAGLCEQYSGVPMPCDFPALPEDALVLVLDSRAAVCEPPFLPEFERGPKAWRVVLAIPPAKQVVGHYLLAENRDIFARYETKDEGGGVGSGLPGLGEAVEILAIDGTDVTLRTTGLTDGNVGTTSDGTIVTTWDSDGDYTSEPCQ
jgi:hypothetical protein